MKRLVILAALVLAALIMKAQAPADSVSIMLRSVQNTNGEIVRLNRAYTTQAVAMSAGGALMGVGFLYAASRKTDYGGVALMDEKRLHTGLCIAATGAAVMVASIIALPRRVHVDERGLVVDLP